MAFELFQYSCYKIIVANKIYWFFKKSVED